MFNYCVLLLVSDLMTTRILIPFFGWFPGNRNKGKGNGAGLAREIQSHCFADKFGITHAHSFGTDTQHDYSQGNCRTMSSSLFYYIIC